MRTSQREPDIQEADLNSFLMANDLFLYKFLATSSVKERCFSFYLSFG